MIRAGIPDFIQSMYARDSEKAKKVLKILKLQKIKILHFQMWVDMKKLKKIA